MTKEDKEGVEIDYPSDEGKLSLCTGNKAQMDDWIASIVLFSSCSLETIDSASTSITNGSGSSSSVTTSTLTVEV